MTAEVFIPLPRHGVPAGEPAPARAAGVAACAVQSAHTARTADGRRIMWQAAGSRTRPRVVSLAGLVMSLAGLAALVALFLPVVSGTVFGVSPVGGIRVGWFTPPEQGGRGAGVVVAVCVTVLFLWTVGLLVAWRRALWARVTTAVVAVFGGVLLTWSGFAQAGAIAYVTAQIGALAGPRPGAGMLLTVLAGLASTLCGLACLTLMVGVPRLFDRAPRS